MPRIVKKNMTVPFFHLMTQGINKEYIFENNKDKVVYEKLIVLCEKEFGIKLLAYCIMNNHTHILIRMQSIESMSKFMHKINTRYAIYYNKKYHRTGYVLKNRYKSQMMNSINIYDNLVKVRICKNRNQYKFSSFIKLHQQSQKK